MLEALHQFDGSANVAGQHQAALWCQRLVFLEQMADALDDHRGLAGAGASEHHQRALTPLDCRTLSRRELDAGRGGTHAPMMPCARPAPLAGPDLRVDCAPDEMGEGRREADVSRDDRWKRRPMGEVERWEMR
jgi:hypothetical protein